MGLPFRGLIADFDDPESVRHVSGSESVASRRGHGGPGSASRLHTRSRPSRETADFATAISLAGEAIASDAIRSGRRFAGHRRAARELDS